MPASMPSAFVIGCGIDLCLRNNSAACATVMSASRQVTGDIMMSRATSPWKIAAYFCMRGDSSASRSQLGPAHHAIAAGQLGGAQSVVGLCDQVFLAEDRGGCAWRCQSWP